MPITTRSRRSCNEKDLQKKVQDTEDGTRKSNKTRTPRKREKTAVAERVESDDGDSGQQEVLGSTKAMQTPSTLTRIDESYQENMLFFVEKSGNEDLFTDNIHGSVTMHDNKAAVEHQNAAVPDSEEDNSGQEEAEAIKQHISESSLLPNSAEGSKTVKKKKKVKEKAIRKVGKKKMHKMESGEMTAVFVGNMPYKCSGKDILKFFRRHGHSPYDANVITDPRGRKKGFGFAHFRTAEEAKVAASIEDKELEGRELNLSVAQKRLTRRSKRKENNEAKKKAIVENNTLFASNLPLTIEMQTLKKKFPTCAGVYIYKDQKTEKPLGFARIWYSSCEEAARTLAEMNGVEIEGRRVYLKFNNQLNRKMLKSKRKISDSEPGQDTSDSKGPQKKLIAFGDDSD